MAWCLPVMALAQVSWKMDPGHSRIGFRIRHMGISEVEGEFRKAEIEVRTPDDKSWEKASVKVNIDAASIDTRNERRDAHLRGEDFFDVEKYPRIRFEATGMKKLGKDEERQAVVYEMPGILEIKGVRKPVTLKVYYYGTIQDPWGNTRAGFRIKGEIDRMAFGVNYDKTMETGTLLVGRTVKIDIPLELIKTK